ncbi:hypothetical protein FVE85_7053 [Porphyridium purpureum]|uniref:Cystinosin-like n=1 Tax=Porphyridium purpureum TaxID=35688 RepID=A0A5J4Z8J2_PORPP|nr:hypothetical protein FVE85_7053 [Porphyridium purpureum]|eukprot:POR6425..scf295_1
MAPVAPHQAYGAVWLAAWAGRRLLAAAGDSGAAASDGGGELGPQDLCTTWMCDMGGLLMTFLQLGQVVPQHWEMYTEQSAVGISAFLLLFGSLYTYFAALDVVLTGQSYFTCGISVYRCFMLNQPLIQMVGSFVLTATLWYWYLKYHKPPREEFFKDAARLSVFVYDGDKHQAYKFYHVFLYIALATALFSVIVIVTYGSIQAPQVEILAHYFGIISAVLNAIMWLPQIYVTYRFKHRGALSLAWVLFSVLMDVVYSVYLAFLGLDWSVWANNIPDGIQTSVLLGLVLYYDWQDRQAALEADAEEKLPLQPLTIASQYGK